MSGFNFNNQQVTPKAKEDPVVEKDIVLEKNTGIPTFTLNKTDVPSKGLSYPDNATISYRPITYGEAERGEAFKRNDPEFFRLQMEGISASFDKWDITWPDFNYTNLLRNIVTFGKTNLYLTTLCPKCNKQNREGFSTTEVEFDDLNVEKLPINVEFSFGKKSFTPLTVRAFLFLLENHLNQDSAAILAAETVGVDFNDKKAFDELRNFYDNVSDFNDITLIQQVDLLLYHGLKARIISCKNTIKGKDGEKPCGNKYVVDLEDTTTSIIFPDPKSIIDSRTKITFG